MPKQAAQTTGKSIGKLKDEMEGYVVKIAGPGEEAYINELKMLAERLDIPQERVALRGEEVLGEVTFNQQDIEKNFAC